MKNHSIRLRKLLNNVNMKDIILGYVKDQEILVSNDSGLIQVYVKECCCWWWFNVLMLLFLMLDYIFGVFLGSGS